MSLQLMVDGVSGPFLLRARVPVALEPNRAIATVTVRRHPMVDNIVAETKEISDPVTWQHARVTVVYTLFL